MTDTEVIKKAVEKAVKNEWQEGIDILSLMDNGMFLFEREHKWFDHSFAKAFWGEKDTCLICGGAEAKAIVIQTDYGTGEEHDAVCKKCGAAWVDRIEFPDMGFVLPAYLYHLQQMVLEENPIDYLRKFVEEEA